jgi:ketosteroid isomerase-like protein
MSGEDRHEAAREVMRRLDLDARWEAALDPDMSPKLRELSLELFAAYRRGDLEWLLEHTDPEIEIVQVPEIPDSSTYTGREGMVDALLDWPLQWDDFRIEPRRVFSPTPDTLIVAARHSGRPHSMDIPVEADIFFAFRWRDGLITRWDMFLTLDEALGQTAEGGAHGDDDHTAERDGRERAQEARAEELRTDHR